MPGANPLMEAMGGGAPPVAAAEPSGYEPPQPGPSMRMPGVGGFGGFSHIDNTSNHVALLVVGAAAVIAFLYFGGFNFGVDAGVVRR